MPEEAVKTLPMDQMPMADYKTARAKGEIESDKSEDSPEKSEELQEKPKSKGGGFQKRIDRLIKQQTALEQRAEAAERRAKELESAQKGSEQAKTQNVVEGEPKLENFESHDAWVKAVARWEARQELQAEREAERQARQNESIKEIFDAHNERVVEARSRIEDFDDVIGSTVSPWRDGDSEDVQAARAFQLAIYESDNGPDVAYYLASNPEEFAKLGDLTPTKVQREVWRLSEKLGKTAKDEEEEEVEEEKPEAKAKPVSKAPTPIKPVSTGTTKSSKALDQMSMAEFKKARAAGRIS